MTQMELLAFVRSFHHEDPVRRITIDAELALHSAVRVGIEMPNIDRLTMKQSSIICGPILIPCDTLGPNPEAMVAKTILKLCEEVVKHELHEWLRVGDQLVLDPHDSTGLLNQLR